jgi:FixJ family two-component response regulator
VRAYASAESFLEDYEPNQVGVLIADVRMPGMSGLELQEQLIARKAPLPVVFITGHGDVPMSVRAMKSGAVEFLTKPFRDQELIDAIQAALEHDRGRRADAGAIAELRARFEVLTPREREVLTHVVCGRLNKQIAADLGLSEATVKMHRGQIMRKMQAGSLPELVRMADRLGVAAPR